MKSRKKLTLKERQDLYKYNGEEIKVYIKDGRDVERIGNLEYGNIKYTSYIDDLKGLIINTKALVEDDEHYDVYVHTKITKPKKEICRYCGQLLPN